MHFMMVFPVFVVVVVLVIVRIVHGFFRFIKCFKDSINISFSPAHQLSISIVKGVSEDALRVKRCRKVSVKSTHCIN